MNFDDYAEIVKWFAILIPSFLFALLVWMNLFVTYPLYFDQQIRCGKNWIYVPFFWKKHKLKIKLIHYLTIFVFTLALGFALFWFTQYVIPWEIPEWTLPTSCGLISIVFVMSVQSHFIKMRYKQQEMCYFNDLFRAIEDMENMGNRMNEQEIRSRVSWEHQSAFLKADESGQFLQLLNDRSKRK